MYNFVVDINVPSDFIERENLEDTLDRLALIDQLLAQALKDKLGTVQIEDISLRDLSSDLTQKSNLEPVMNFRDTKGM